MLKLKSIPLGAAKAQEESSRNANTVRENSFMELTTSTMLPSN